MMCFDFKTFPDSPQKKKKVGNRFFCGLEAKNRFKRVLK